MEIYYTHQRGLEFFLELTGNAFEGRIPLKVSDVEQKAMDSMRFAGGVSWLWDEPRKIPKHKIN